MKVTADQIIALADGFRAVVQGSRKPLTEWRTDRLGPTLGRIVSTPEGSWRADGLALARIVLRRVVESYDVAPAVGVIDAGRRAAHERERVRSSVARYWGVSGYPSSVIPINPLVDREADEPDADAGAPTADIGDGAPPTDAPHVSPHTLRRWARQIAGREEALQAAAAPLGLRSASLDPGVWDARGHSIPLWNIGGIAQWPPDPMPGGERRWLLDRLLDYLGDSPRIVGRHEDKAARDEQLLQILRRREVDLHAEYLGDDPATQPHFFHLRHRMARRWFVNDLLDFTALPARADVSGSDPSPAKQRVLDAQAAIARMAFYQVVHEWNDAAMEAILDRRSAARLVFLGVERLAGPLERRADRVQKIARRTIDAPEEVTTLPEVRYVTAAVASARRVFELAQRVRAFTEHPVVAEYIRVRKEVNWEPLDVQSRRTILLADHAVHLAAVNLRDPALLAALDELLQQSAPAARDYAAFIHRDHAMLSSKTNTRAGLGDSMQSLYTGVQDLLRSRAQRDDLDARYAFDERANLETIHQMSLAMAGTTVKVLEGMMRAPAQDHEAISIEVVIRRVRAAVQWSAKTILALERLDEEGMLTGTRYSEGYLAEQGWRVASRIIRHRNLCTAYVVARSYELGHVEDVPTLADLDAAYLDMITTPNLGTASSFQVVQGALLHSFVSDGILPFPGRIAPGLRRVDFLTADVDPGRVERPTVYFDQGHRISASLYNVEGKWDCGALEEVTAGSAIWHILDARSGGDYSQWRRYMSDIRANQRENGLAHCRQCHYYGPPTRARPPRCPRCHRPLPT